MILPLGQHSSRLLSDQATSALSRAVLLALDPVRGMSGRRDITGCCHRSRHADQTVPMSTNSYLRVRARYLLQTEEGFDPHLAALFDESDLRYGPDDLDDGFRKVTYEYVIDGKRLGQRLRALGVGAAAGLSALQAEVVSWQREADEIDADIAALVPMYGLDDLLRDLRQYLLDPTGRTPRRVPENLLYRLDPRALLAALCDLLPNDTEFALTLSELISHSLLEPDTQVCAQARETLRIRA